MTRRSVAAHPWHDLEIGKQLSIKKLVKMVICYVYYNPISLDPNQHQSLYSRIRKQYKWGTSGAKRRKIYENIKGGKLSFLLKKKISTNKGGLPSHQ